jgi:hypothetical protein
MTWYHLEQCLGGSNTIDMQNTSPPVLYLQVDMAGDSANFISVACASQNTASASPAKLTFEVTFCTNTQ